MAAVNKVILIGNLGADPEVRYMPNGDAVANIRLATTESWKDKNSGEKKEMTEWHRVVFYRKLAEIVDTYLKKGSAIYVEGRIRTRKWQDKEGQDRYTTEIEASEMQMLGGTKGGKSDSNTDGNNHGTNPNEYAARSGGSVKQPPQKAANKAPAFDEDAEDLPF